MEYLTDLDEFADALGKVDMNLDLNMKDSSGFLMESQNMKCYNMVQRILDVPEMEKCHKFCLNLNFDNLVQEDLDKVNELYNLGVSRGFIGQEEMGDFSDEEGSEDDSCPMCCQNPRICQHNVEDHGDGVEMDDVDSEVYESIHDDYFNPDDPANDDLDAMSNDYEEMLAANAEANGGQDIPVDVSSADTEDKDDFSRKMMEDYMEENDETSDSSSDENSTPDETTSDDTSTPDETTSDDTSTSDDQTETTDDDSTEIKDDNSSEDSNTEEVADDNDTEETSDTETSDTETETSDGDEGTEDSTDDAETETSDTEDNNEEDSEETEDEPELTSDEKKERKDQYIELWRKTLKDLEIATPISEVTDPSKIAEFWDKISSGWDKEDMSAFMTDKDITDLETSEKVDDVEEPEEDSEGDNSEDQEGTSDDTEDTEDDANEEPEGEQEEDSEEEKEEDKEDK